MSHPAPRAAPRPAPQILAVLGIAAAGYFASVVLVPIVLAFFAYVFLDPLVATLQSRWRVPRRAGATALVTVGVAIAAVVLWGAAEVFGNLVTEVPQYSEKIKTTLTSVEKRAALIQNGTRNFIPKPPQREDVQKVEIVGGLDNRWTQLLLGGINSLFGILAMAVLVPILALFLLFDKPHLKRSLAEAVGDHMSLAHLGQEMGRMVKGYFFWNFLVGGASAVVFFGVFTALGLDNAVTLGVTAGFVNLMPFIGPILGAALPIAQSVLQFDTMEPALTILGASLAIHLIVANFVIPRIIGSKINVNSTAALIGLIFWSWLWGGIGLLLAIPLVAALRILLEAAPSTRQWAPLLAEDHGRRQTRALARRGLQET